MKRSLLVTVTLALTLIMVAGCSGSSTSATGGTPATSAGAAVSTVTAVPTATPTPTNTPTPASGGDVLTKMKNIKSFSADVTMTDGQEETTGKITVSGSRMRMDMDAMGVTMGIIIDESNKTGYMYNPEEKKALFMPYDEGVTGQTPGNLLDWEKNTTAPPKLIGQETVDGKSCAIYEFTTAEAISTAWLDKETGFPIKYETTEGDETVSASFTKIVIGKVDESVFTLPEGTEILDLTELMATPTPKKGTTGTPTPRKGTTATPTPRSNKAATPSASSSTLVPTTIVGAVSDKLKSNVSIPSGFRFDPYTGQEETNLDTGVYKASARWIGSASPIKVAEFYAGILAGKWQRTGSIVSDLRIDVDYKKIGTNPAITLNVTAVTDSKGTVLTLTIANGDPNADPE